MTDMKALRLAECALEVGDQRTNGQKSDSAATGMKQKVALDGLCARK